MEDGDHLVLDTARARISPPAPTEIRSIFASIGLEGDFWDPQADVFP